MQKVIKSIHSEYRFLEANTQGSTLHNDRKFDRYTFHYMYFSNIGETLDRKARTPGLQSVGSSSNWSEIWKEATLKTKGKIDALRQEIDGLGFDMLRVCNS